MIPKDLKNERRVIPTKVVAYLHSHIIDYFLRRLRSADDKASEDPCTEDPYFTLDKIIVKNRVSAGHKNYYL